MKLVFFGSSIESAKAIETLLKKDFNLEIIVTRSKKPKRRGSKISTSPVEEMFKPRPLGFLLRVTIIFKLKFFFIKISIEFTDSIEDPKNTNFISLIDP